MNGWQILEFWAIGWGLFFVGRILNAHYLEWLAKRSVQRLNKALTEVFQMNMKRPVVEGPVVAKKGDFLQ